SSCRPISPSFCCRRSAQSSTRSRTSGSSCATTGSPTASSNPTTISSTIVVRHGTSSSISLGASCPSDCANGPTGSDQWDLVLELKLAELTGAVDILRGAQPPPPAQFPSVKAFSADTIYHEGDIVAFAGGTWQAQRDTARVPGAQDWVCLASAGDSFTVRGTFNETAQYHRLDVVALNGGSFIALKDAPGLCPGPGWQLIASQGKRGAAGEKGERGAQGPQGNPGLSGATIRGWKIDREKYVATPLMSDGSEGP